MKTLNLFANQTVERVQEKWIHGRVNPRISPMGFRFVSDLCVVLTMLLALGAGEMWGDTRRYYCKMEHGWWTADGAAIGIYAYGDGDVKNANWPGVRMTSTGSTGEWYADIDTKYTSVIFTRVNGSGAIADWGAKTSDLELGDYNYYTITSNSAVWGDPGCTGEWSKYAPSPAISGDFNSWKPDSHPFSDGSVSLTLEANSTYEFKVVDGTTWYGRNSSFIGQTGYHTMSTAENNCHLLTAGAGTYTFTWDNANKRLTVTYPLVTHPTDDYIYFKNDAGWSDVYVHLWNDETSADGYPGPPAETMDFDGTTYYFAAIGTMTKAIFGNNNDSQKTDDIEDIASNMGKWYDRSSSSWKDFTATLTLDHQSPTNTPAPNSITVTCNSGTNINTNIFSATPEKKGYTFGGYYTSAGGEGTQIINESGKIPSDLSGYTASGLWIKKGSSVSTTLYAKWTGRTYNIVYKECDNSTLITGLSPTTYTCGVGVAALPTPIKSGYTFDGWYSKYCVFEDPSGPEDPGFGWVSGCRKTNIGTTTYGDYVFLAKWHQTVTLDMQGVCSALTPTVEYLGTELLDYSTGTVTLRDGTLLGYYTAPSGGTKVLNADGSFAATAVTDYITDGKWTKAGATTLYAHWDATIELPDTLDVSNYVAYGGGLTIVDDTLNYNTGSNNRRDGYAEWQANMVQAVYNVTIKGNYDGTARQWQLSLINSDGTVDSTCTFTKVWQTGDKTESKQWNLSGIDPEGEYIIRLKNLTEWGKGKVLYVAMEPIMVTYDANGGSCGSSSAYYTGSALTLPSATKSGYVLEGWYSGSTKIGNAGGSYVPTASITLTAKWGPIVNLPNTLTKSNIALYSNDMTWYGDDDEYFDFGPTDASNLGRWAKWEVNVVPCEYNISVDVDFGGSNAIKWGLILLNGTDTVATYNSIRKDGYRDITYEAKWDLTKDREGEDLAAGTYTLEVKNIQSYAQPKLKSLTLTPDLFTVSYAAGTYGSGSLAGGTKTGCINYTLSSSDDAFTRAGYTYDGWSTNADGSTKDYNLGATYSTDAAVSLYPHWTCVTPAAPTDFTAGSILDVGVTFAITDDDDAASYDIYYSTTSTAPTAGTTPTATSDSKTKAVTGLTAETSYYAWVRSVCDGSHKSAWVALNPNGATHTFTTVATVYAVTIGDVTTNQPSGSNVGGEISASSSYAAEDAEVTLTATPASGYTFISWKIEKTSDGSDITASVLDGNTLTMPAYAVTVKATFAKVYSITYKETDKTTAIGGLDPTSYIYGVGVAELPTPTKTGYTFDSWYSAWCVDHDHSGEFYDGCRKTSISSSDYGSATYYATWTGNNYTVTLNNQSATSAGTESISVTYDANTNLTSAISEPLKTGYAFGGYYTATGGSGTQIIDADGNVVASASDASYTYTDASKNWKYVGNITLYAKWIAVTTVPDDPGDKDICQITGLFGLSEFACQGLDGRCAGATEVISSKNTRHIYGITGGDFFTNDLRNAPARDHVHFEVWAPEAFTFTLELAGWNSGFVYSGSQNYTTQAGAWKTFDVALSAFTDYANCFVDAFTGFRLSNLANKDVWFANVYLYSTSSACAAEPATAPSAPTYPACQVQSIYSDTYASVGMSYADWGSGSTKADRTVAGTHMYKVTVNNGNFGGLIINGKIDGSSYEYIHMDVWTPLASTFRFSPICWNYTSSGNETEQYKADIATSAGTWTSVDIPVSYFTGLGLTMRGNYQLKIDQCTSRYFWITNIYYYNASACPSYTPAVGEHHFGTAQRQNVALYSDAGMATGRHANTTKPLAQHFDYYIVDCGDQMLAKTVTRGKLGTGVYDQMVLVWNNAKTAYGENKLSKHNGAATVGFQRIGDADQYNWYGQTTTAPMNFYMTFQEQTTGTGYSEFFDYQRGYINNPNSDATAPSLTSVSSTEETNWFTLSFTGGNDNSGQWFYYIEDTEFDYYKVSLEDTIRIPKVDNGQIFHFNCYAVDFNGNMSEAKAVTIEMPYTSPSTTNLALKKPIAVGAGTNATYVNDGDLSTRNNGANSDYINQWIYIDLKGYYTLSSIKIWFETAYTDNFVLQAAHTLPATINDDTQWRTIYTNTATPNTGNAVGDVNTYNVSGSTARYVRIKSYNNPHAGGAYGFAIYEFEVYGSAATSKDATAPTVSTAEASALVSNTQMQLTLTASDGSKFFRIIDNDTEEKFLMETDGSNHVVLTNKTYAYCEQYSFDIQAMDAAANLSAATTITPTIAPPALYNLATGATATAGHENRAASLAVDGDASTRWSSEGGSDSQHWITVDLKKKYTVSTVKLSWEDACPKNYYLKASLDGTHFYPVGYYTTAPSTSGDGSVYTTYTMESGIEARYLQMYSLENNTNWGTSIYEFEAYGSCASNGTTPIMTFAEVIDMPISSSSASAEINVGAWDDATAFDDLNYRAVFTAGKSETINGLTATDGILTLSGLTIGTTYTVRIYAVDGNSNVSANYKELTFTPKVKLYYLTGDATGTAGVWEGALSTEESAAKRRFSATVHDGVYNFSITVSGDNQQYRLYYDVEGDRTYRNDNDHWCTEGNQVISGHNGETITVYAKGKDHFVSNFDEVYVYGAAVNAASEGAAFMMTYDDNKFTWEGPVATGTNAFRIIVKNNGSSFNDHSRARIMPEADNFVNSAGWKYAKLIFNMETWEYEWTTAGTFIFDNNEGEGDGKWSTASNWLNKALPTIDKDVILQAPVEVDITTAQAKSVEIDQYSGKTGQLTIAAGKELVVAGTVQKKNAGGTLVATEVSDVFIGSSSAGNGALVIGSHDGTNKARVLLYTKTNGVKDQDTSVAQYLGTPFNNETNILHNWYNSWIYGITYNGSNSIDWVRINEGEGMTPFRGYCVYSADGAGHIYDMEGTLNATSNVTCSGLNWQSGVGSANVNNENLLANSWTAPIRINAFVAGDFVKTDATVYIFNATSNSAYVDVAGNYTAYTPGTAGENDVIPSMQSFSVFTNASGGSSVTLDYERLVYNPAVAGTAPITPNYAPNRKMSAEATDKMHLYVSGTSGYSDMLYLLENEDFQTGFENGWDGRKLFGEGAAPQLYALTPDGEMTINCVPTWEGTVLGFRKGTEDNAYAFTFDYEGEGTWYLNDLREEASTLISSENTYTFTTAANDSELRFVISATPLLNTPTGVNNAAVGNEVYKIIHNDHVYIVRQGRIFDVTGVMVR